MQEGSSKRAKDIIFFSNYCEYSKAMITLITKSSLNNYFLRVCIDGGRYQLPPFVDRVPCILNSNRDRAYFDDDVELYIMSLAKDVSKPEEIQTFSWESSGFDNFAVIGDDMGNMSNQGYMEITDKYFDPNSGPTRIKESEDSGKGSRFNEQMFENMIANRNRDEEQIKKILKSANGPVLNGRVM